MIVFSHHSIRISNDNIFYLRVTQDLVLQRGTHCTWLRLQCSVTLFSVHAEGLARSFYERVRISVFHNDGAIINPR